jgi:hypothetical protein
MSRWTSANAPLTYENLPTGERRPTRSGIPVSPGMLTELQRQGVAPAGFGTGAAPGAAPTLPAAGQPPTSAQPPTGTVGQRPLYYDQQQAEATRNDPLFQNAFSQQNLAKGILTSLSQGNRQSSLIALAALVHTVLPNARAQPGQSKEQIEDLTSKWFQMSEEYERYLKSDLDLPDWLKTQIGQLAVDTADNSKAAYDKYYAPIRSRYRAMGGSDEIAYPQIDAINPAWKAPGGGTTGEGALPAPGPARAPTPAQAPGTRPAQQDILKELGIGGP